MFKSKLTAQEQLLINSIAEFNIDEIERQLDFWLRNRAAEKVATSLLELPVTSESRKERATI